MDVSKSPPILCLILAQWDLSNVKNSQICLYQAAKSVLTPNSSFPQPVTTFPPILFSLLLKAVCGNMAHLAPFKTLLTICMLSITLGVVQPKIKYAASRSLSPRMPKHARNSIANTTLSLPCSSDQFACADGSKCIPMLELCNGYDTCADMSHNSYSQCDNCAADHLFRCKVSGIDVCLNTEFKMRWCGAL